MKTQKQIAALTADELNRIVPIIRDGLIARYNKGIRSEKSGKDIITELKRLNIFLNPARLRKMIHHIVIEGLGVNCVLIANSKGYIITNDPTMIRSYRESLQGRINSQIARLEAIERDFAIIENRRALKLTDILYPDAEK